ncbi:MAG TPA: LytTR family DNA-binding domain-containing protein [Hyphomonadaceae bacterium]|jgi:DNA-binding LytR/AlgR family response regulator
MQAELAGDRRADRRTLALIAALALVSLVVVAVTRQTEAARLGTGETGAEIWLLEATSHAVIVGLAALFPLLLDRVPVGWNDLKRTAPALLAAWIVFTLLHVTLMHALRALLFPLLVGQPYAWRAFDSTTLGYEGLKDLFVFLLLMSGFLLSRSIEASRLEQQERISTARTEEKIILRVGAAMHAVPVREIVWAKAAANYAEVHGANRSWFARMTFASLEESLKAAGGNHARIHRSYIVSLAHIASVEPTGEGDVTVVLTTGDRLPGSRNYRTVLDAIGRTRA